MRTTRRSLFWLGAAAAIPTAPVRIASLDYGLAQTALALGAAIIGLPDPADYANWVVTPPLTPGVADLGARTQPNLDVLRALRPDLILAIDDHAAIVPLLAPIAPVLQLPIATPARIPWERSVAAARAIGAAIGAPASAERLVSRVTAQIVDARAALAGRALRPLLLASFLDPRHLLLAGRGTILHDTLERLGLRDAWTGPTGRWGTATIPLERLAAFGDATLCVLEPTPPDLDASLAASPLWRALPFRQPGRLIRLPPVLMFGTLPAAERFAGLLVPQLLAGAADA